MRPDMITPYARHRLVRLLVAELSIAWEAAIAAGVAPVDLAAIIDERSRLLREGIAGGFADDQGSSPDQTRGGF
jgi:hypothetical protein